MPSLHSTFDRQYWYGREATTMWRTLLRKQRQPLPKPLHMKKHQRSVNIFSCSISFLMNLSSSFSFLLFFLYSSFFGHCWFFSFCTTCECTYFFFFFFVFLCSTNHVRCVTGVNLLWFKKKLHRLIMFWILESRDLIPVFVDWLKRLNCLT